MPAPREITDKIIIKIRFILKLFAGFSCRVLHHKIPSQVVEMLALVAEELIQEPEDLHWPLSLHTNPQLLHIRLCHLFQPKILEQLSRIRQLYATITLLNDKNTLYLKRQTKVCLLAHFLSQCSTLTLSFWFCAVFASSFFLLHFSLQLFQFRLFAARSELYYGQLSVSQGFRAVKLEEVCLEKIDLIPVFRLGQGRNSCSL